MKTLLHLSRRILSVAVFAIVLGATVTVVHAEAVSDIFVGYSGTWRAGMGGTDQANAAIYNQFGGANNVAAASGSPHRMNVIGTKESAFDAHLQVNNGDMIGWMRNYDVRVRDFIDVGNYLGADQFLYVGDMADNGSAAQAEQPGRFSSIEQAWLWYIIVAHETGGHNYGLDHRDGPENPKTVMVHNYCGGGAQPWLSNPNIWLNGVKLQGLGNCQGGTTYGGDDAYKASTTAQGMADTAERRVWGSNLSPIVKRWQFNKPAGPAPAGTIVADDVGGAQAIVRGQGASFTGTGLRLPGGTTGNSPANSIAAYIDLPNGMFSSMPNFTLEVWATPITGQDWMRVIEMGRTVEAGDGLGASGEYTGAPGSPAPGVTSASDAIGVCASRNGGNLSNQRLLASLNGTHQNSDSDLATTAGELYHYAITFADSTTGGTVKWFRNGALVKTLDVPFHSASLEDVNNWLGRSLWSSDSMANIEYRDVRIKSVAIADGEVAGNYRIGPHDKMVTMWANDAWGNSSWVNGAWEFGHSVPDANHDYEVGTMRAITPWTTTNNTFPGRSLTLTGGNLYLAGKNAKTATVNDLRLNGATVIAIGDNNSAQTLAGNIKVPSGTYSHIRGAGSPMTLAASITGGVGGGGLTYTENPVTLTGSNTGYLGATIVGDGRFGTLRISSETNLGGNPSFYGGAWLQLNRGILETTTTMTIDDANRGILIDKSAGIFRPAAGTTLTIASTVNSPAAGNTLQTAPMNSNPILGMFFKEGAGTLVLTNPNNSHNAEMQILEGELRINGAGRLNNGDHWMPITLNSTLNYNSTANQILSGAISGNGVLLKNNSGTLAINGSNPFTGTVTINAGTLYANPANAPTNRAFSFASSITVNNGGTLRTGSNGLFGWDGTQDKAITVNAGGSLTANGGLASDVGVGTVTLNGGTLATLAAGATDWGSFRFDNATDKLIVTADSTASASNVKFGTAAATIQVAAAKTLNFTGTVTDTVNGGISYLTKTGTGVLTLGGSNAYTGATAVNAGTLRLTGSLGNSAVSVAGGATFSGAGSVGGSLALAANALHTPGNPVGTQTVNGALSYAAASRLKVALNSNSNSAGASSRVAAGTVNITGGAMLDLVLNGTGSSTSFSNSFWSQSRTWSVMTGTITGSFTLGAVSNDSIGNSVSSRGSFSLQQNSTSVVLVFIPSGSALTWQQANFGEDWNNPLIAGDSADPDQDSIANLLERAFGGDPNKPDSEILPAIDPAQPLLTIVYRKSTAANDLVFLVQQNQDLSATWLPAEGNSTLLDEVNGIQRIRFTAPAAGGEEKKFLRVQVIPNP